MPYLNWTKVEKKEEENPKHEEDMRWSQLQSEMRTNMGTWFEIRGLSEREIRDRLTPTTRGTVRLEVEDYHPSIRVRYFDVMVVPKSKH